MDSKGIIALVVLSIAAYSPAPINDRRGKSPKIPEQSQEQLAKQQALTGAIGVVGQVPMKLNSEKSEAPSKLNVRTQGENALAAGSQRADMIGGSTNVIQQATERVKSEEKGSQSTWLGFVIIALLGYGSYRWFIAYMNKITPVPKMSQRQMDRL